MGERVTCPYCGRGNTALTKRGLLAYHNRDRYYGVLCPAGGLTVDEAKAKHAFDERTKNPRRAISLRPTVQVMDGETGDDSVGDVPWITLVAFFGNGKVEPITCYAPAPRAP